MRKLWKTCERSVCLLVHGLWVSGTILTQAQNKTTTTGDKYGIFTQFMNFLDSFFTAYTKSVVCILTTVNHRVVHYLHRLYYDYYDLYKTSKGIMA